MRKVFKYELPLNDYVVLDMEASAELLHVAEQHGQLCLWALVNPLARTEKRLFRIAGTGHPISDIVVKHVGSVMLADGALVFHVFEVPA